LGKKKPKDHIYFCGINFKKWCEYTLENTEGAIKNG